MEFEKKKEKLMVYFENKIVGLKGHQDNDTFTVFTESLETHPSLTQNEIKEIEKAVRNRNDIIID